MEINTIKELRQMCKQNGIKGYYRMNKPELIFHLNRFPFEDDLFSAPKPIRIAKVKCEGCSTYYDPEKRAEHFRSNKHLFKQNCRIVEVETAFQNRLATYHINNNTNIRDPSIFLASIKYTLLNKIQEKLVDNNLKVNLKLFCNYKQLDIESEIIEEQNFKTRNVAIFDSTDLEEYYAEAEEKLLAEVEEFERKGSGWVLYSVNSIELRINTYVPLRGSSYVALPKWIQDKKAVVNVENNDDKCFMWSLLSFLHPVDIHTCRLTNYIKYIDQVETMFNGIRFPMALKDIRKFERQSNISVNVYSFDEQEIIFPVYVTKDKKDQHIYLLYIKDDKNSHYCWIKSMSRLVGSQLSKYEGSKYLCDRCLLFFNSEYKLNIHKVDCKTKDSVKVIMPSETEKIQFKNYRNTMKVPFVIYADFKCLTKKIQTCAPSNNKSYTHRYQKHEPSGFCYYIKYIHKEYKPPVVYRGPNAAKVFMDRIRQEVEEIGNYYDEIEEMLPLTNTEIEQYNTNNNCTLCGCRYTEENKKVRHHDHLTGKYIAPLCNTCNLKCQTPKFVPVFFHNLSGYDSHLFIKELAYDDQEIDLIPCNEERFISYTKHTDDLQIRFVDSFKFMSSGLENLAKNLKKEQKTSLTKYFKEDEVDYVTKKLAYCYDYMDSWSRFTETSVPPKSEFYSELNDSNISDTDYEHVLNVWNKFNMQNLGDLHDLYVKTDVLLLADIFENFRLICYNLYKLDQAWYFTTPGLTWDAMLKYTKQALDLISDYDMILMIEKGIRGGIAQCCKRYVKANNKYMEDYDPAKSSNYVMYLDANNLYGWAMSQKMPYVGFEWASKDINLNLADDANEGYIAEVDLEYPMGLHDLHNDLLLAPESKNPPGSNQCKLLTTLDNKKRYVLHYRSLKQCLSKGMVLKQVHRVISFRQSYWLKNYIDLNTEMRKKASSEFEKDFYKLMNNSIFGKSMENIRKYVNIILCPNAKKSEKLISKPNFKHKNIFTENLVAIHMNKTKITFNKPIYIGLSILDISKELMYDFHYNVMKQKYKHNIELLYQDTDSYIYNIITEDFYEDMKHMIDHFDTSDYPVDNKYNIPIVNKKVLGKMKDVNTGSPMTEFVGLKAKMYAFDVLGKTVQKKAKARRCPE